MSLTKDDLVDITELMSTLLQQQERRLNKRFDAIDQRLDGLENRMDRFEKRMDAFEERMDDMDVRFDEVLGVVGGEFVERSEQITDHKRRITRLEHRAQSA